jgi:hypothetical protein
MREYLSVSGSVQPCPVRFSVSSFEHPRSSICFFDSSVKDMPQLVLASDKKERRVFLSPLKDGLEQIARHLEKGGRYSAVHLMAEFSLGRLSLGNKVLILRSLRDRGAMLARIGRAMKSGGQILIGAGRTGDGPGEQFCRTFESYSGVPVRLWDGRPPHP